MSSSLKIKGHKLDPKPPSPARVVRRRVTEKIQRDVLAVGKTLASCRRSETVRKWNRTDLNNPVARTRVKDMNDRFRKMRKMAKKAATGASSKKCLPSVKNSGSASAAETHETKTNAASP